MANPVQVTAANQWTDEVNIGSGRFSLSVFGSSNFVGTITIQRRRSGPVTAANPWRDIKAYTGVAEESGEMPGNWIVRAGCKVGEYTSGSVYVEISS